MAELDDPERLAAFRGSILELDGDPILQECVERAAKQADAPMAMISLVMKNVQVFRAAFGLPIELEVTRAASRSCLFCQFVVEAEGPFIVGNAKTDERVPQLMVETYGIGAYVGVPIRVGEHVLGSLCVADGAPRQWRADLVGELLMLAGRASERLETLDALDSAELTVGPASALAGRAVRLAQIVRRSMAEVGPMVRLAGSVTRGIPPEALLRAGSVLTEARDSYEEMMSAVAELCLATRRLEHSVARTARAEFSTERGRA